MKIFLRLLGVFFCIARMSSAFSQTRGCIDPLASNYSASATINDGSCSYPTTTYTPPIKKRPISSTVNESSGLQWVGNSLWTFNDSGGQPEIYRIDVNTGAVLQTVKLQGATNVDWEDISFDGTFLYIGDVGNNANGARTDLKIYKFPVSAIPDYSNNPVVVISAGDIQIIAFAYSNQPQPPVAVAGNSTKFDCEAFFVDGGKIHLFTKNWITGNTSEHYVIDGVTAGNYVASYVETLNTGYLVTGADKRPNKNLAVLLGYQNTGLGNHYMHVLSDFSGGQYFNGNKRKIDLGTAMDMGQAEGITFSDDTHGYISNEYFSRSIITTSQSLYSFDISKLIANYVLPLDLIAFEVVNANSIDRLYWTFDTPVENMRVEYSTDGIHFSVVQTYSSTEKDKGSFTSYEPKRYYRLVWKGINNEDRYSSIITSATQRESLLSNFTLRTNGNLACVLAGHENLNYSFRILSVDGKVIGQTSSATLLPGNNNIHFSSPIHSNMIYVLQIFGENANKSLLIKVTD